MIIEQQPFLPRRREGIPGQHSPIGSITQGPGMLQRIEPVFQIFDIRLDHNRGKELVLTDSIRRPMLRQLLLQKLFPAQQRPLRKLSIIAIADIMLNRFHDDKPRRDFRQAARLLQCIEN